MFGLTFLITTPKFAYQNVESADHGVDRAKIIGHRGAIYHELENTRAGFQKCAEMGCDAVELDVFQLKCGTVVVFHGGGTDENPGDLWDYCGEKGSILDLTYDEARQLRFNPNFAEFPCPKSSINLGVIPKLEDVLMDAKKTGLNIKIELKGPNTVKPTLDIVDRLNMVNQCSFSTFDLDRLAEVRRMRPQKTEAGEHLYKTGALFNDIPPDFIDRARKAGASEIHIRYDTCTPAVVSQIHDAGFGSMCWFRGPIGMTSDTLKNYWDVGNEDESMYATVLRTGVQQMCLNRPDVMLSLQRKRERVALDQHNFDAVKPLTEQFIRPVAVAR